MKLYQADRTPNSRRVLIFLAEKGIEVETASVDLGSGENRESEFLAKNPLGLVPILELDDGTHLRESMAICRYFEARSPEPALFGKTALEIGTIEMWSRHAELELLCPVMNSFRMGNPFWKDRLTQVPAYAEVAREQAAVAMSWFNDVLAERPFLAGEAFSVADITLYCAVDFARIIKLKPAPELEHLHRWRTDMTARPSISA